MAGRKTTQEKLATASVELQQMGFALQELALSTSTRTRSDDEAAQLFNQYVEIVSSRQSQQYQQGGWTAHAAWTRRQAARMTGSRDRGPGNTERSG